MPVKGVKIGKPLAPGWMFLTEAIKPACVISVQRYHTKAVYQTFMGITRINSHFYCFVGGLKFYDRRDIKDVIAYLRLIANPSDAGAFDRLRSAVAGRVNRELNG